MRFGFGKKEKAGRRGGRSTGWRLGLGRKGVSLNPEQKNITCICPECGASNTPQKKVQCFKMKCSRCGSAMTRRLSDEG